MGPVKWPRLVLAFAGLALLGVASGASGVVIPSQMRDYQVDRITIGALFFGFSTGYLLSGLGNGALVNRLGVRTQLTLGVAVYFASALGIGLHVPFGLLVALTFVSGAGSGVIDAGFNAYLTSQPGHTALLNFMHAFFGVGALIGPLMASRILVAGYPWQDVYLVLAVIALPVLVGSAALLPRRVAPPPDAEPGARLAQALRRREVWFGAIFLCLYVGAEVSVGNWGFSFLTQHRGQGDLLAGYVVSVYWLGLTLGRLLINSVSSRAGVGVVAMLYACFAGMAVAVLIAWHGPGSTLAVLGFGLLGFFLGPIFPTTVAVVPRLTPPRLVPSAVGFLVGMSVVGGAVFPYIAGAVAQGIGTGSLMPYLLLLAAAQVGAWWLIARRLRPTGRNGGAEEAGGVAIDADRPAGTA